MKLEIIQFSAVTFILAIISLHANKAGGENSSYDLALQRLKEGNERFTSGKRLYPSQDQARREIISRGQHPYVTILSCSDSRVPVEHIFDTGIGDVFVVRVAGNVADTDEIGTIEYGVGHLHTPLLIVLGHTACGAVTAVTRGDTVHGSIAKLVDNIGPAVIKAKKMAGDAISDQLVSAAIEMNVWQSIEDCIKNSSEISSLIKNGKLKAIGAIYDINSGNVKWLGEHPYQANLLSETDSQDKTHSEKHGFEFRPCREHNTDHHFIPPSYDKAVVVQTPTSTALSFLSYIN
jgi:carbonic anhydrase